MIKKLIWTAVFVSMGLAGTLAAFGIADIWNTVSNWWNDSLSPLWEHDPITTGDWFAFIGGTIWTAIIVAPLWYLWKGVGIFTKGGLIIRTILIVLLYLLPTIMGALQGVGLIEEDAVWMDTFNIAVTWIIIGLALAGLWIKS